LLAHLHESADHKDAHGDGFGAIEDGGGHDGAMFGESIRWVFGMLAALLGRNLRS
jgi:hypothetical protein